MAPGATEFVHGTPFFVGAPQMPVPTVCFAAVEIALRAGASRSAESALARCSKSRWYSASRCSKYSAASASSSSALGCSRTNFSCHSAAGRRSSGRRLRSIAITFTLTPRGNLSCSIRRHVTPSCWRALIPSLHRRTVCQGVALGRRGVSRGTQDVPDLEQATTHASLGTSECRGFPTSARHCRKG